MKITMLASHFKGANFSHCSECALARAASAMFPLCHIREGVHWITIDKNVYFHEEYDKELFEADMEMAREFDFSDKVAIRVIKTLPYDQGTMDTANATREYTNECVL